MAFCSHSNSVKVQVKSTSSFEHGIDHGRGSRQGGRGGHNKSDQVHKPKDGDGHVHARGGHHQGHHGVLHRDRGRGSHQQHTHRPPDHSSKGHQRSDGAEVEVRVVLDQLTISGSQKPHKGKDKQQEQSPIQGKEKVDYSSCSRSV